MFTTDRRCSVCHMRRTRSQGHEEREGVCVGEGGNNVQFSPRRHSPLSTHTSLLHAALSGEICPQTPSRNGRRPIHSGSPSSDDFLRRTEHDRTPGRPMVGEPRSLHPPPSPIPIPVSLTHDNTFTSPAQLFVWIKDFSGVKSGEQTCYEGRLRKI